MFKMAGNSIVKLLCLLCFGGLVNTARIGGPSSEFLKIFGLQSSAPSSVIYDPCYEEGITTSITQSRSRPRKCIPDFVNSAFGKEIIPSHTCGEKIATKMCFMRDGTGVGFVAPISESDKFDTKKKPEKSIEDNEEFKNIFDNNVLDLTGKTSLFDDILSSEESDELVDEEDPKIPAFSAGDFELSKSTSSINELDTSDDLDESDSDSEEDSESDYTEDSSKKENSFDVKSVKKPTLYVPSKMQSSSTPSSWQLRRGRVGARRRIKKPGSRYTGRRVTRSLSNKEPICHLCDSKDPKNNHGAHFLTDLNNPNNLTCWQSNPFAYDAQNVSLTLSLGKKYELTYVSLQFCGGVKPDSLAIYKSMDFGRSWQPFQFYSSQCEKIYGRPNG